MTEETGAAPSGGEQPAIPAPATPSNDGPLTVREAARSVLDARRKEAAAARREESAAPATPAQESEPQGEGASPQPEVPGETEVKAEPELPAIEPPRSWTTEHKERWASLPRETQEYLAERERHRDRDLNLRQQEATEARKAVEAERAQVQQARAQYEQALPILLSQLQAAQDGEFSDVKSMSDVQRLATEDPLRFSQWQARQMQIGQVHMEIQAA